VLVVAAVLRLPRAVLRWDETSWLYAAYDHHTLEALANGRWSEALAFTGLHPPLYPLIHAALELLIPVPAVLLALSVLCSWGAVLVVARHHVVAGLMLACAPVQLHYAAELNDYPLTALAVACVWVTRERVAAGTMGWGWLAAAGVFAAWSHALAGLVAGLAALSIGRRAPAVLAVMVIGTAPLWPGALDALSEPGTLDQPPFKARLVLPDALDRFGPAWLGWLPLAALGARTRPALAGGVLGTWLLILLLQVAGLAAPHQFPYYVLLGAPLALLASPTGRGAHWAVALAGWCGLTSLTRSGEALLALHADQARGRAIDLALATAPPAAALYLLAPPVLPDDDKRADSPVLWRLPPWQPMPMVQAFPFEYGDHRNGQPRRVGDRVVYLNDWPRPAIAEAVQAHGELWIVVSDPGERRSYTSELADTLGAGLQVVGPDVLIVARR